jgi:hypothetical protein
MIVKINDHKIKRQISIEIFFKDYNNFIENKIK